MIGREELYARDCVAGLIHVVEQVPPRAADRGLLSIDNATAGMLLLWSLLRWERTFAIRTLERLNVDLCSLTQNVNEALTYCGKHAGESRERRVSSELDMHLRTWLDRAAEQARTLRHDFLGIEHLLLAMLARNAAPFAEVLGGCGLTYNALKEAIVAAVGRPAPLPAVLSPAVATEVRAAIIEEPPESSAISAATAQTPTIAGTSRWIAEFDRPAVGVPRRFGVFLMMLMVTLYAVLFSVMRMLRANGIVFALLAFLFTGIGVGQAVLFGGRFPRAASIWIGSILVPLEMLVFCMFRNDFVYFGEMKIATAIAAGIVIVVVSVPLGAIFGYLFGTVTAGGFYLVDRYEKRRRE